MIQRLIVLVFVIAGVVLGLFIGQAGVVVIVLFVIGAALRALALWRKRRAGHDRRR